MLLLFACRPPGRRVDPDCGGLRRRLGMRTDEAFGISLESLAEDNLALGDDLVGPAVAEDLE